MSEYLNTAIWKRTLGPQDCDPHAVVRERLRSTYEQFWKNACALADQIQKDIPFLTLHDESHFNALWRCADQILGEEYKLNPLEAFVFGGAILLHDAANSTAAFPNRLESVKLSPEFQDVLAETWYSMRDASEPPVFDKMSIGSQQFVLLQALRSIHAERAEELAGFSVKVDGIDTYLLDDSQIRNHLGSLIGKIAASHHWSVEKVGSLFGLAQGALAGFPREWTIRPLVIAGLLRTSDAIQLDQGRAPDFLFGLLNLRGISESHWRAQNRLSIPYVGYDDPNALVFTSTRPFGPEAADSWWIAHDAIAVANRELQAVHNLLRDTDTPPFAVQRIRGADDPSRLAEYVQAEGWTPVSAQVSVSRVDRVIDMFGGEKLYGAQPWVTIREMIQNAADAIYQRREHEAAGSQYVGKIVLRAELTDEEGYLIDIVDDGLGMSQAVLTGPLIDFGSSYMSSALVKSERPGLLSKRAKRIGQYGVGFFSAFMIAEEVWVHSRPYDSGLDRVKTLHFSSSNVLRPILMETRPAYFDSDASTVVRMRISADKMKALLVYRRNFRDDNIAISFSELVKMICVTLDVDVMLIENGEISRLHGRDWSDDPVTWLDRIARWPTQDSEDLRQTASVLLQPLVAGSLEKGLAAVVGTPGRGVKTIGGLRANHDLSQYSDEFSGAIEIESSGPRRSEEGRAVATPSELSEWASAQADILLELDYPQPARQVAAQRIADHRGDSSPIAAIKINGDLVKLIDFCKMLADGGLFYSILEKDPFSETIKISNLSDGGFPMSNWRADEKVYLVDLVESTGSVSRDYYYRFPVDGTNYEFCFIDLVIQVLCGMDLELDFESAPDTELLEYVGIGSERDGLRSGDKIVRNAVRWKSVPKAIAH